LLAEDVLNSTWITLPLLIKGEKTSVLTYNKGKSIADLEFSKYLAGYLESNGSLIK
jgi:hypothetical protein